MVNSSKKRPGRNAIWTVLIAGVGIVSSPLDAQTGNTMLGNGALAFNSGDENTAVGEQSMSSVNGGNQGSQNTAVGKESLYSNLKGTQNTAIGCSAMHENTEGVANTAVGQGALFQNTAGHFNTALGYQALYYNNGGSNTGIGLKALAFNDTGEENTAIGRSALFANETGRSNTANGAFALFGNTGSGNTASGSHALYNSTSGHHNAAAGFNALYSNTTGFYNTAEGFQALFSNTTGRQNTADGVSALYKNTTGLNNSAVGFGALVNNTTGSNNVALGTLAGQNVSSGSNNVHIGNVGVAGDANTTRVGSAQTRTFIAGIRGRSTAVANAVPVVVDSNGQLGTASSSKRFKHDIKPMEQASEGILDLKPVTFLYNEDASETAQFGLIAEEVEKVNPDLVVRNEDGKIYTVRYDAVNAMLLNEFQKAHRKVEQQEATIAQLKAAQETSNADLRHEIDTLAATVKEQSSLLKKVSAQLEESRSPSQLVLNKSIQ